MKLRPQTEMKVVAGILASTALIFIATLAWTIPLYLRLRSLGWQALFRTEAGFEHFMEAFCWLAFLVAPCVGLVCGACCGIVLKHYRKLTNEKLV